MFRKRFCRAAASQQRVRRRKRSESSTATVKTTSDPAVAVNGTRAWPAGETPSARHDAPPDAHAMAQPRVRSATRAPCDVGAEASVPLPATYTDAWSVSAHSTAPLGDDTTNDFTAPAGALV